MSDCPRSPSGRFKRSEANANVTMAAKMTETSQEATAVSRREEFSDFSLVLEDGRELKCHKDRLAEASPVFRMILKQDGEEARTNKMKITY